MADFRNDADATYFVANQLESMSEKVYAEYPEARYSSIVPVDSSDDEGAEQLSYIMYDKTGISQIISAGDSDSPSVDLSAQKFTRNVFELGNHITTTSREARNAKFANMPLDSDKVYASAQTVEQHHDEICMLGDGTKNKRFGGMFGIVFNPNVTKMVAPKTFANSSASEIIAEFANIYKRIIKDTKQIHRPDTWAVSDELVAYLQGVMVTGTSVSVWERLKATYAGMKFETHYVLENVGKNPTTLVPGDTPVIMCYKKSPRVLQYKMPMPWRLRPSVNLGRSVRTEAESTSAGVVVKNPLAVVIYYNF